MVINTPITLRTQDAYLLGAHLWTTDSAQHNTNVLKRGVVVINPATAVKASYYHRYAHFLAEHGFVVLTYDYRGIGASRQGDLRQWKHITKLDWGRLDCEAALAWCLQHYADLPLLVVAHSIGGMVIGLAPSNKHVVRCLTVGAQYAYWPDYAGTSRLSMWLRWHFVMPVLTALLGYFPAKKLGWHEDLPAGAAYEWAFRGKNLEKKRADSHAAHVRVTENFQKMTADILAIGVSDDPFGTPVALERLLAYFTGCRRSRITVTPADVGQTRLGHFTYFHEKFRDTLWRHSLGWLTQGQISNHSTSSDVSMEIQHIKLYHYPASRSARVKWMLHEVLEDSFEIQRIDLHNGEQYLPEYLQINPNHSVPVLEITWADGRFQRLTESAAMVIFLADAFSHLGLAPPVKATPQRAAYLQILNFASTWMDMMLWQIRIHEHVLPDAQKDARTIERYRKKFQSEVEPQLMKHFESSSFACGENFSAADCVLGHTMFWAIGYGLCQNSIFKDYLCRIAERPAFKKAFSDKPEFVLDARNYLISKLLTG